MNLKPVRTGGVPFLIKELYKRTHTHIHAHTEENMSPWQPVRHINSPKLRATHHRLLKHTPRSAISKQTQTPGYYSKGSVHTCTCECSTVNNEAEGSVHPNLKTKSHLAYLHVQRVWILFGQAVCFLPPFQCSTGERKHAGA